MAEDFRGKKVLVTGGGGFIGSNLVDALVEQGAQVTVLDDLFAGDLSTIKNSQKIDFIRGSIANRPGVDDLVKRTDLVFHLAARTVSLSTGSPEEDYRITLGGVLSVLLAVKKYGVERLVFASSASVYGNARRFPINEDDPLMALFPYAASKIAGEMYCLAFHECYELPVTILRFSNVYGPSQNPKNPGLVARFLQARLDGQMLHIHGDGEQTRDYTYVGDTVDAALLAATCPKADGEIFNIATGRETSVNHLARLVMDLVEVQGEPVHIDRRDIDNLRRRVLNVEKARRILRWIPMTPLEKGLKKTLEWLRSQQ